MPSSSQRWWSPKRPQLNGERWKCFTSTSEQLCFQQWVFLSMHLTWWRQRRGHRILFSRDFSVGEYFWTQHKKESGKFIRSPHGLGFCFVQWVRVNAEIILLSSKQFLESLKAQICVWGGRWVTVLAWGPVNGHFPVGEWFGVSQGHSCWRRKKAGFEAKAFAGVKEAPWAQLSAERTGRQRAAAIQLGMSPVRSGLCPIESERPVGIPRFVEHFPTRAGGLPHWITILSSGMRLIWISVLSPCSDMVWPWASYLTSLKLAFLIFNMVWWYFISVYGTLTDIIYRERCLSAQGMVAGIIIKITRNVSYFWFCQRCREIFLQQNREGRIGWSQDLALALPVDENKGRQQGLLLVGLGWMDKTLPGVWQSSTLDGVYLPSRQDGGWTCLSVGKVRHWGFRTIHRGLGQQTFATRKSDHRQQTAALCLSDSTIELFSRANGMKWPLGIPTPFLNLIDIGIWPWVCGDEESEKLNIDILSGWGQDDHCW